MQSHNKKPAWLLALGVVSLFATCTAARGPFASWLNLPTDREHDHDHRDEGTNWAVLIAGSAGYGNYRHQSDVCHAYQVLHSGGLSDDHIIVFMYDDIAAHPENPHPGTIINRPGGPDVYHGVPKDYTGQHVTAQNFLAVLAGDKGAVAGIGSGRVVESRREDRIFVFFSDHGGPGVLGMPTLPFLYADQLMGTLRQMRREQHFREMVLYVEACESGSIFDGLLGNDLSIYVTTASNPYESSWGTYCPGMIPGPPPEYMTCLGDLYSISWMENSESHNLEKETLEVQYEVVRDRTSRHGTFMGGSHVMQYGELDIVEEDVAEYLGSDPANENMTGGAGLAAGNDVGGTVEQRDADLLHLWHKFANSPPNSLRKAAALDELNKAVGLRAHIDRTVSLIGQLLFGHDGGDATFREVRPAGVPLVDSWDCLREMVRTYEGECGLLTEYGMKHMRAFANICNSGRTVDAMRSAAKVACAGPFPEGVTRPAGIFSA